MMTKTDNEGIQEDDSYLDNLFNDGSGDAQEETPSEQETSKGETEQVEESETPAEEKTEAEAESKEDITQESWTKAAVLDERRKRQDYEKKVEELEARIKAFSEEKQQVAEPKKAPDPIDDPEAFAAYQDERMFSMALKFDQRQLQEKHNDYDDTVEHFKKMAGENPALVETFKKQEFPATYAYNTAKADLNAKKYQDPKFLENLEKELEEKILAKLQSQKTSNKPDASSLPKLNGVTSVASNVEQKMVIDDADISVHMRDVSY